MLQRSAKLDALVPDSKIYSSVGYREAEREGREKLTLHHE